MLDKIANSIRYIEKVFIWVIGVLLMLLMFLGSGDVIGRYFFNSPIMGTLEASEIMMAGIVLLGLAYTQRIKGHVRVDLIVSRYPPRAREIANFIALLVSFILFCCIFWQSLMLAIQFVGEHRTFQVLPGPSAPYRFFVPAGALLLCLEFIIQMVHTVRDMRKGGAECLH